MNTKFTCIFSMMVLFFCTINAMEQDQAQQDNLFIVINGIEKPIENEELRQWVLKAVDRFEKFERFLIQLDTPQPQIKVTPENFGNVDIDAKKFLG